MTLDLQGNTLTFEEGYSVTSAFDIAENASLTITDGTIIYKGTSGANLVNVAKNGALTIDANIRTVKPIVAGAASNVVLTAGHTLEGNLTVTGDTDTSTFGAGAATVELNGIIDGAYSQANDVNATITGSITNANGNAVAAQSGSVTLNGAHLEATGEKGSAVFLSGEDGSLTVKGCSVLSSTNSAGLYISATANVSSVTINNSTLKSTNNSAILGGGKIDTVIINGSRFEAEENANVKSGSTVFTHATYDGTVLGDEENVLQDAKGTYGVDTVACDAPAADEGEDKGEEAENPNTADTIATYMTIAAVALLGLGATAFVAKKSNR